MKGARLKIALSALVAAAACAPVRRPPRRPGLRGLHSVVGHWGKRGKGNGSPGQRDGLATDKAGNVYVADFDGDRIQIFSSKGAFQQKLAFASSEFVEDVAVARRATCGAPPRQSGRKHGVSR